MKKQFFVTLSLFGLLIAIVVAPIALLELDGSRLIGSQTVSALPPVPIPDEASYSGYDSLSRIWAIRKPDAKGKSSFVVSWVIENAPKSEQDAIVREVERQLSSLQTLSAVPKIDFSEINSVVIAKKSYMSTQDPGSSINLMRIYILYRDLFVSVYMDAETACLYDVSLYFKAKIDDQVLTSLSAKGFLTYLQADSDSADRGTEIFDAEGVYTSNSVWLYAISHNKDTLAVTSYGFEEDANFIRVTERSDVSASEPENPTEYQP